MTDNRMKITLVDLNYSLYYFFNLLIKFVFYFFISTLLVLKIINCMLNVLKTILTYKWAVGYSNQL